MQKLFYLVAGIGIVSVLGAQPAEVDGALALALQRNSRVQALQQEILCARRLQQSASALSAPSVLVTPAITTGGVGEELIVHQPLEIIGIRQARMRVGQAQYELTLAQATLELNDLLAEVAVAYYEYAYRQRIAQTAQEALQLAERTRDTIQQQVEAGARAGVDLIQAEIELERVRQHALLRRTEAQAALERLKALLGGDFESPHPPAPSPATRERGSRSATGSATLLSHAVGEGLRVKADPPLSHTVGAGQEVRADPPLSHAVGEGQGVRADPPLSHTVGAGQGVRADPPLSHAVGEGQGVRDHQATSLPLRPQIARLRLEQTLLQQIRAESLPDLGVQLRIERFQAERTRPAFGLTLSLPLLDYGARQNRLRAQNNLIEAQRLRLQQARLTLEAELRNAQQRLQQAQTRYNAYQTTLLPRAQQLAQAAQVGLEAGQLSILQLLESQRTARAVQEEALEAELLLKRSEVELQRLRGAFLPKEVNL